MSKIIIVDEFDRDAVQRADVECSARMNLITYLIKNDIGLDNARFQEYQNDYTKSFGAFEMAKKNLETKYLSGKNVSSWSLDYATCELSYE
jgi:hypothetical protein